MNPKSLEALIIDRRFGELSPETAELLDAYIEANPLVAEQVASVEEALSVTELAITNHPVMFSERVLHESSDQNNPEEKIIPFPGSIWLKAVAAISVLALVGTGGYFAGTQSTTTAPSLSSGQPSGTLLSSTSPSPWAQYRIAPDGIEASIPTPSPKQQP